MSNARGAGIPQERQGDAAGSGGAGERRLILRWLPLGLVVLTLLGLYAAGLQDYLSLDALRRYQGTLVGYVESDPVLASAIYVVVYVLIVAVSFPGSGIMTITGGFLFGAVLGTALASVASTIGATLIFLIARTSLGAFLAERAGPRTRKLREGFQEEGFSYLLFLRLVPLFPFWLVNLAAALFGMRLPTYFAATAVGVVPAAFVFAYFGHGLGDALDSDRLEVPVGLLVALALLGVLALTPIAVRRLRRGKEKDGSVAADGV
jgi:uncharacterized membrane protein YdjX (TVP38/TMEM64 family)